VIRRSVLLAALVVAGVVFRPDRALRTGIGTTAHDLCSETFVARLDTDQAYRESIAPRPGFRWIAWAVRYQVDRTRREVQASLAGLLSMRAVFRPGLGCVLVHADEPLAGAPGLMALRPVAPLLPEIAGPADVVTSEPRLRAALDAAFLEPAGAPHRWTKAIVIVHDGRVVAERYAPGYGSATPILGFSMTKSVTSALIGVLVRQGRLTLATHPPFTAWQREADPRRAITVEQLMRMTSGLALDETGSGFDPSNQMFYDEPDMAGYAEQAALIAPPGTRWSYSSASTHLLARLLRDSVAAGRDDAAEAVQRFAFSELFDPLGMRHVTFEADATGTPIGAHYLFASARDWARFGMLYLDDGVVGGQRLLPEGWVQMSARPTLGTAYGAGWWTNRGDDPAARHRREVGVPADAFFAFGNLGQRIAVLPAQRLVIVRLGRSHRPYGDNPAFEKLIVATIAALADAPAAAPPRQ
jgi:CubicO group peptidase (beta-lactamase class C family)